MTALILLMVQARKAGLVLDRAEGDRLTVRGDRRHDQLVRQILNRKGEALALVELYTGRTGGLDWRSTRVSDQAAPCVLCRRPALLRDPFDGLPVHKTCTEQQLSPRQGSATSHRREAAA